MWRLHMTCPGRWIESNASIVPEDEIRLLNRDASSHQWTRLWGTWEERNLQGASSSVSVCPRRVFCSFSFQSVPEPLLTLSASGPIQTHQLRLAGGREERAVYIQTNSSVFGENSTVAWKLLGWTGRNSEQPFPATTHGQRSGETLTKSPRIVSSYKLFALVIFMNYTN